MTDTIVVLGKRTVRKTEIPHLEAFARAVHMRHKQLVTTRTDGVPAIIAKAFEAAGGTPQYMTGKDYKAFTAGPDVVAFTDMPYQKLLNEKQPGWRDAGWLIIHNPKATEEAAAYLTQLLADWGTPIEASA